MAARDADIPLLYGPGHVPVRPPARCVPTVIQTPARPSPPVASSTPAPALAAPVDDPPRREAARGKRSACILIGDVTRPAPNGLFLGPLVRTLLDAGLPRAGITGL